MSSASAAAALSHLLATDAAYLSIVASLSNLSSVIATLQKQIDNMTAANQLSAIPAIQRLKGQQEEARTEQEKALEDRRRELEEQAKDGRAAVPVDPSAAIMAPGLAAKRMLVCDVCGTALVAGDDDARMAAHRAGKQHAGYETIREWMAAFEERKEKMGDLKMDQVDLPPDRPAPRDDRTGQRSYDRGAPTYERGGYRGGQGREGRVGPGRGRGVRGKAGRKSGWWRSRL